MEAENTRLSGEEIALILFGEPNGDVGKVVERQAEVTWRAREPGIESARKEGMNKVVEWLMKHSQLEKCDPQVMAYFEDYRWVDENEWQAQLTKWGIAEEISPYELPSAAADRYFTPPNEKDTEEQKPERAE